MLVSDPTKSPPSALIRQLRGLRMVLWSSWPIYLLAGGALLAVGVGGVCISILEGSDVRRPILGWWVELRCVNDIQEYTILEIAAI